MVGTSAVANVSVVRQYSAAWNAWDVAALDAIIAPDVIDHTALPDQHAGIAGYRQFFGLYRRAFPDLVTTIEDVIAAGDKVVVRWAARGTHGGEYHGIAPTGRTITFAAISIMRVADGKITDEWVVQDEFGLRRQLTA